jgi:dihydrofolate synthase/folylpolyglutamate synthase
MKGSCFSDTDELYEYLLRFVNVEKGQKTEFKLDRMSEIAAELGHPEESIPAIHVAGSKGKGSVSTMIARILEASGERVGLYTSPHILRWKERISLAGDEMPEQTILTAMASLLPLIEGRNAGDFAGGELPTFFELTTLVAFETFRLAGCTSSVIETGLGGRLDSTNIVPSLASVITPIELEHCEWLGDSIPVIAREKAGIIKKGRPVCVSHQKAEALEVFRRVAAEQGSPLLECEKLVGIKNVRIDRNGTSADFGFPGGAAWKGSERLSVPLIGAIQSENMALAILASSLLLPDLDPETAGRGLARATLPARFQIVANNPAIVLDGAHTPNSVALALDAFEGLFPGPKALLFACAHDKKHAEMAEILASRFSDITITAPGSFKQSDPSAVHASFRARNSRAELVADPGEALARARDKAKPRGMPILVTGSFYLCAEVTKLLLRA